MWSAHGRCGEVRTSASRRRGEGRMVSIAAIDLLGSRPVFDERGHPFTLYELKLTTEDGSVWTVERRFSEFRALAAAITDRHKASSATDTSMMPPPPSIDKNILSAGCAHAAIFFFFSAAFFLSLH